MSTPKTYTALITQQGTDDPSVAVLSNTFGGEIVWKREGGGVYIGKLAGAFPNNKTFIPFANGDTWVKVSMPPHGEEEIAIVRYDDDTISISFNSGNDGRLQQMPIRIEVYP